MRKFAFVPVMIAVGAAAACSSSPAAAPAAAARPQSCKQQYAAWKHGPARPVAKQLTGSARTLSSSDDDVPVMLAALRKLGKDAATLESYPMPKCADPAGYWHQELAAIKASGDNAGSASGLGGLLMAEVPLKKVHGVESKLSTELLRTVDVKKS